MNATTLILLPGLDGTGELFRPFIAAAPDGAATIPVAYPTHLASYEEIEPGVRDKLADNSVILAESFSGPLGVRLARDSRVRALILCNSFVSPPRWSWLRHLAIGPLFARRPPASLLRWLLVGNAAPPGLVEKVQEAIGRVPAGVVARRLGQVLSCNERSALSTLAKPVFYLRGINDALVPSRSWREISSLLPETRIAEIVGPHLLLQVKPEPCWEAILAMLNKPGAD